jgi:hypothetical protein
MIYAYALTMFASIGLGLSAMLAGLAGEISTPAAVIGAVVASLVGWACAGRIDLSEKGE